MAGDLRKVDRLLTFARENGEEEFQTFPAYCNFKAKPKIALGITITLIRGLKEMYFDEECIYWCEKINGKCKRDDQYFILSTLLGSYHNKGHNHALVIKYGHEALALMNRASNRKSLAKGMYIRFALILSTFINYLSNSHNFTYALSPYRSQNILS